MGIGAGQRPAEGRRVCLPSTLVSRTARRGAVKLQSVLALPGPVLAAIDFA